MNMSSKKTKVCFQSTFAYPLFNSKANVKHGGSEVQMYLLSKELAKDDNYDVSVVVGDFGQNKVEKYDGVEVIKAHNLKKNIANYLIGPFKLYNVLKKINPDVVVQRSACAETGICAFYCKRNNKRFIYSVAHDMDINGEFANKGITGKVFKYGIKKSNKIVLQNRTQEKLLHRWFSKLSEKSTVIRSGYEIKQKKSKKRKYFLWVGRSDHWKRPESFIKLAKQLPNENFLMIMPKSSDLTTWNKNAKKTKNLENIKLLESVPFEKINDYFEEAKALINTSSYEGFPNTFIQAAKNKTPIISMSVNPDKFPERFGFYCHNRFDELVEKTKEIGKNNKKLIKLGNEAYDYVNKQHDIKKIIKEWKRIIQ